MAGQRRLEKQIRTRLDLTVLHNPNHKVAAEANFLDERWLGKSLREHVKEFSCVMALVLSLVSCYIAWHRGSLATVLALIATGFVLVFLGYRYPRILHPVWKSWMSMAMGIGVVMTFLLLTLGWTLVLSPFALVARFAGKRMMDLSYAKPVSTYWEARDTKLDDFSLLERQY